MNINTSKSMRSDNLFMRNEYSSHGKWNIPLIKKQAVDVENVTLIACSDTRSNDNETNTKNGVHFFVDDYRFNGIYNNPEKSLRKYSQYAFLLSPDFSTYADMNLWRQLESVAKNRWCGCYWQEQGLTVIPTISWSTPRSYEFCFDGVEKNSIIAIGMIGCKQNKKEFLRGYDYMLSKIEPEAVICFGTPFDEMRGNIIPVDYRSSRKVVR
ncbi:MAG: DUF4417 domain-containing protein [Mobilibacterium timonense]|uniref:DUF4417 domain-containing protein n=1 Tax=Mobilibacterium timonense TaxID=1871012 RepID=UPI0009877016|nr:DUF4417 domain-containing protein [Mobilibacterium timonense]MBM6991565.1 DUF4417 domain-containing protein [Mobilibacterium timonense]